MHGCWAHQELGAGLPEGCYPPGGVKSALLPLCHEPHRLPEACRSIPQPCVSKAPPFHDGGKTAELKFAGRHRYDPCVGCVVYLYSPATNQQSRKPHIARTSQTGHDMNHDSQQHLVPISMPDPSSDCIFRSKAMPDDIHEVLQDRQVVGPWRCLMKLAASKSSGVSGPSSTVRARRQCGGTCASVSVTLGVAVTRSLLLFPVW